MEAEPMKHIKHIGAIRPKAANALEDSVCAFVTLLNDVITAFSGASPFTSYLAGKCSFAPPE
jgi:hypothetical protein